MAKVKICGIMNMKDALLGVSFGADSLGFNFYSGSARYIAPETAAEMVGALSSKINCVGVFVNESVENVLKVASLTGVSSIQLHGDEDAEFVNKLKANTDVHIAKAFRVANDFQGSRIAEFKVDSVLLDAFVDNEYGGTGKHFDWELAKTVSASTPRLYLAGGLNPENVAEAISIVRPYAVDVASGVESALGKKDPAKLEAFIRNAKMA